MNTLKHPAESWPEQTKHIHLIFFHMYLFQGSCFASWRLLQELVSLANLEYISKSCTRSHGKQIFNARPWAVEPGELVPVGEEPQCHVIYLSGPHSLDFMYLQSNILWNKYPNRVLF